MFICGLVFHVITYDNVASSNEYIAERQETWKIFLPLLKVKSHLMFLQSSFHMYNLKITISNLFHNWFWDLWMKNVTQDECKLLQQKLQHNVNSYKKFYSCYWYSHIQLCQRNNASESCFITPWNKSKLNEPL